MGCDKVEMGCLGHKGGTEGLDLPKEQILGALHGAVSESENATRRVMDWQTICNVDGRAPI